MGCGCRLCLETIVEGFPGVSHEEVGKAVFAKEPTQNQKKLKKDFLAAKRVKKDIGIVKNKFQVPTFVHNQKVRTRTIYSECGFLTESEFQKLCHGISGKKLGLKPVQLPLEDLEDTVTGYYVSLSELPIELMLSIRKVRTELRFEVTLLESRLDKDNQIREVQGQELFKHFSNLQFESADRQTHSTRRTRLPLLSTLQEKALALKNQVEARQFLFKDDDMVICLSTTMSSHWAQTFQL